MGNIIELCAAYLYPEPRIYLGFVMCLTRDYNEIPEEELVQDCALEHGIDFDKLNACSSSDDGFGIEMLRKSVTRSKEVRTATQFVLVPTYRPEADYLIGWCLHELHSATERRNLLHTRQWRMEGLPIWSWSQ